MIILDNITKKVTETAKAAAKKSGDIVEVTKLNISIGAEEEKIEKVYKQIGKEVFNRYMQNDQLPVDVKPYCDEIQQYMENLAQMKSKINELKKVKYCPSCNSEMEIDAAFCSKCGAKQEEQVKEEVKETVDEKICATCGNKLKEEDAFCSICGTKAE